MRKAVVKTVQSESFDVIRTVNLVPTKVSLEVQKRGVPVYAELTDFASDLYSDFNMPFAGVATQYLENAQRFIAENVDACNVESAVGRDRWTEYGLDRKKIAVIPNGVDTKHFSPKETKDSDLMKRLGLGSGVTLVLHGDFGKSEGIENLLRAIAKLGNGYHLLLCGTGPSNYLEKLRRIASELGVRDRVAYPGWVDYSVLPSYLALGDVAVSPFIAESWQSKSNLHTKIREYISMRMRLVVTETPGLRSAIDGIPFYVTNPRDADEIALRVSEAVECKDFEERKRKMNTVAPLLDWQNVIGHDEKLMRDLVNGAFNRGSDYDLQLK